MTPSTDPQGWGRVDGLLLRQPVPFEAWHLLFVPALLRGSGDHGSLLPLRKPKSKPIPPMARCNAAQCTATEDGRGVEARQAGQAGQAVGRLVLLAPCFKNPREGG